MVIDNRGNSGEPNASFFIQDSVLLELKIKIDESGSHTSAIISYCKTKNVTEFVPRELPVRHNTRCLTNIPDSC